MTTEYERFIVKYAFSPSADCDLGAPQCESAGASGLDLRANLGEEHRATGVIIEPGEVRLIGTGIRLAVPDGVDAQIRPRSGLALKHSVTVLNSPGTIDSDYRGEIGVILINLGKKDFLVMHGARIAQLVFCKRFAVELQRVEVLGDTTRGENGFGSSG